MSMSKRLRHHGNVLTYRKASLSLLRQTHGVSNLVLFVNIEALQLYKSLTFRVLFFHFPSLCHEGDTEHDRQCNIEVRSCNHGSCGKAISITNSERVSLALLIRHAVRMRHIVICACSALICSAVFFHGIY
jgi:hypothetical protein